MTTQTDPPRPTWLDSGILLDSPVSVWSSSTRLVGLAFLDYTLVRGKPGLALHGQGLAVLLLGGVCNLAWLLWLLARRPLQERRTSPATLGLLTVFGLAGAVLSGLVPQAAGTVFPAVAAMVLATCTPLKLSATLTGSFVVTLLITSAAAGNDLAVAAAWCALILGLYGIGQGRRSRALQLETVQQLLVETERANAEQAHGAALAERGRIAREIHDVLAHSLSALTVQLEAADALLADGNPDRAHDYVVKARRIAREGLVETRRAITALREDVPPLPALLDSLAQNYRDDLGVSATVTVLGEPRPLTAESALAVYRTAQESLTNIRKHAPGAEVELTLAFEAEQTRLTVSNGPARGGPSPLAGSGGGYGLTGLRERAELAAGTLTTQPVAVGETGGAADDPATQGWAVTLTIPAVN